MTGMDARMAAVLAAADAGQLYIRAGRALVDQADVTDVVTWALTLPLPLLAPGPAGPVLTDVGRARLDAHTLLAAV